MVPETDMPETQTLALANAKPTPKMQTKTILYYAGHIIAVYESLSIVDIF